MTISSGLSAAACRLAIGAAVCFGAGAAQADEPLIGDDIAFEHLVDRGRVVNAIVTLDADALTDIAIQFSEAERVLLRPHKVLPTDRIMKLAVKASVESRREDTLNRLEQYARQNAKDQLANEISAARKLAGTARTAVAVSTLPIGQLSPDVAALYEEYQDLLKTARIVGEGRILDGLESSLQNDDIGLPDALRDQLMAQIADSRAAIPAADSTSASLYELLVKPSRGNLNQSIVGYCRARIGRRVGDGECATLVTEAYKETGARRFPPNGPDADYVWGRFVYGIEVSGGLEVEDGTTGSRGAQPGDIIQFRNASFKGQQVNTDGSRRTWTARYTHHTAVIASVSGRRWTVYHQNVGPQGKSETAKRIVQIGRINLNEMDSGWLKVYRPVSTLTAVSRSGMDPDEGVSTSGTGSVRLRGAVGGPKQYDSSVSSGQKKVFTIDVIGGATSIQVHAMGDPQDALHVRVVGALSGLEYGAGTTDENGFVSLDFTHLFVAKVNVVVTNQGFAEVPFMLRTN